jgi:hypothetical protein
MKRLGFAFVVAAVVGCQSDRVLPAPSALIKDALHNDGNAFFFWTSPVVNQQPPSAQIFSADLSPVITITDLCNGSEVRSFSGSQISVSNARYHANWRTSDDNLSSTCNYRITVTVGTKPPLGFADVDVVDNGRELKNVNTGEIIPLLDGRTLPINFFVGVGSQCGDEDSDCGEGTVRPDRNTVIVTTNGQAGLFVPAGAVPSDVIITIESSDDRPCFDGLPPRAFPGDEGQVGNSCYDYRTDPPLSRITEDGKFFKPVTVGICAEVGDLDHATRDLLQIFQFDDEGEGFTVRALNNVAAPFLRCDPGFNPNFGARHSGVLDLAARGLRSLVQPVAALFTPRPLYAGSNRVLLDIGTGGSTDGFSRFTWALPSDVSINFDEAPGVPDIVAGTVVNSLYSRVGVTFSRTNPAGLCAGVSVYANDHGPGGFNSGQNNVTPCREGIASDFSEAEYGAIQATFTVPAVQACITATVLGFRGGVPGAQAFIEAFDASGEALARTESRPSTADRIAERLCVPGPDIAYVRFAGKAGGFAIFDNLEVARSLPPLE